MKLRPVLLVLLLLSGFYYVTTHGFPSGHAPIEENDHTHLAVYNGPLDNFQVKEAAAAPAFDAEEQQNIGVYRKALPSVVNITSTAVAYNFFNQPVPQQGQGSGFILTKEGLILTNNHVIDNAQRIEVTLANKHKYKATLTGVDKQHDLALITISAPDLVPQQGQGSGFILTKEGLILTNNHVIDNAQRIEVTLANKHKYKATLTGVDKQHDLALITISAPDLVPATLSDSNGLMVGQRVYAIGNPFGLSGTMTRGIISAIRSIGVQSGSPIEDAIQTDAAVNPGNSGGPLLNSKGEVIGITTLIASNGSDQSAGIGFAIPINTAKAVLDDFARYGRVRRPSLDIVTFPIGPDVAEQIGLPADFGVLIQRVLPGGAAEKAGLRGGTERLYQGNEPVMLGGDLIVGIDGQEIQTVQDLSAALNGRKAGDTVVVTVFRGQRRMDVKVVLSDMKDAAGQGRST